MFEGDKEVRCFSIEIRKTARQPFAVLKINQQFIPHSI
jgi:hypothetical protein